MDLDTIADELYAAAPEEFVALRKQRAAEVRKAGERELAKRITALRRPTRSAWIVNLIADQTADDLAGLLDLGAALAEAQQRLSGDDLRRLSGQRHAAIAALSRRGRQLAEVRGHRPTEATMREVSETLQSALSDPAIAELVRSGHLAQAQTYGGFGPELAITAPRPSGAPQAADTSDEGAVQRADDHHPSDHRAQAEAAAHERLLEDLADAQAAHDRITLQAERATQELTRLTERADRRAELVDELLGKLERARAELDNATEEVEQHRSRLVELQKSQRQAEEDVSKALTALTAE